MFQPIFKPIDGETRCIGYTTIEYSSDDDEEIIEERTEDELKQTFEDAKERLGLPDNVPDPVEERVAEAVENGIENPQQSMAWLRLEDGEIVFDEDHPADEAE